MFILPGCENTATEPNPISVPWIWIGPFHIAFMQFQTQSIAHVRQPSFNWSDLRKFWERTALLIFSMCSLTSTYSFFFLIMHCWFCFAELKQSSLGYCFLHYIRVWKYAKTEVRLSTALDYNWPPSIHVLESQVSKSELRRSTKGDNICHLNSCAVKAVICFMEENAD